MISKHWGHLLPDPAAIRKQRSQKRLEAKEKKGVGQSDVVCIVADDDEKKAPEPILIEVEDSDDESAERREFDSIMMKTEMTLEDVEARISFLRCMGLHSEHCKQAYTYPHACIYACLYILEYICTCICVYIYVYLHINLT